MFMANNGRSISIKFDNQARFKFLGFIYNLEMGKAKNFKFNTQIEC